jgi:ADP-dependent NAD(P)H-hydrate dehydratase
VNRTHSAHRLPALRATTAALRRWPLPLPSPTGDKEDRGNLLIIAGSVEVPGAAILAATASLRAGAGKVTIATPATVTGVVAQAIPEARVVSVARLGARAGVLTDTFDAVLIGPGIVKSKSLRHLVLASAESQRRAVIVLDAGAIAALADRSLRHILRERGPSSGTRCVITPHAGEMASLLEVEKAYVENHSPLLAARLGASTNTVVALKGATTWIACPGQLWSHQGRNSGLATAGSGDVLAGVVAGLAARGATAAQATVWGVVLHALSGASLRRRHGALGMLARELPHEIPKIMEALRA